MVQERAKPVKHLGQQVKERVKSKLESAAEMPAHFFDHLSGLSLYKLRIGDHRLLADIDFSEREIFVLKVGHRKDIYAGASFK